MKPGIKRSSTFLIVSQLINAGGLFLFWIISARLFTVDQVGMATAFISFGILVATFSNLGLPNTIIRFLQSSLNPRGLFLSASVAIIIASTLIAIISLGLIKTLAPSLSFVFESIGLELLLILFVVSTALNALIDGAIISFKRNQNLLIKSLLVTLLRLSLPFLVVTFGIFGITSVYSGAIVVGISYNLYIIFSRLISVVSFKPEFKELLVNRSYSISNYFGGMFGVLPITLVPIIVFTTLGSQSAAYFYMPIMIAAVLSLICSSISQTLIAECAHIEDRDMHREMFLNALKHQYQLLIPLVSLLIVLGWPILRIYGETYASNGYIPLVILAISGLLVGFNWLGDTWLNINRRSKAYFLINAFNATAVVSGVLLFSDYGLVSVAIGWMLGQLATSIVFLAIFVREGMFKVY